MQNLFKVGDLVKLKKSLSSSMYANIVKADTIGFIVEIALSENRAEWSDYLSPEEEETWKAIELFQKFIPIMYCVFLTTGEWHYLIEDLLELVCEV